MHAYLVRVSQLLPELLVLRLELADEAQRRVVVALRPLHDGPRLQQFARTHARNATHSVTRSLARSLARSDASTHSLALTSPLYTRLPARSFAQLSLTMVA